MATSVEDMATMDPLAPTNWSKCILCQTVTKEKLCCPSESKRSDVGAGYTTLINDLISFDQNGFLPSELRASLACLQDKENIHAILHNNSAKFHKTCRLMFNKNRLQRTLKRRLTETDLLDSGLKVKESRSSERVSQRTDNGQRNVCIFCDKESTPQEPLHEAMTKTIGERVKSCATKLLDKGLMVKVYTGDLVANGARYHAKCLVALYNAAARVDSPPKKDKDEALRSQAFSELHRYILDSLKGDHLTVFRLSDLVRKYTSILKQLDQTTADVHPTRLKDHLLGTIPQLNAFRDGRGILLVPNGDVGSSLIKAQAYGDEDYALSLSRAADIIRNDIMKTKETFDGTFSQDCQERSVPESLVSLVAKIMYGTKMKEQSSITQNQAVLTVSQLILFNSFSRVDVPKIQRHNRCREPPLPVYLAMMIHNKTRKKELVDKVYDLGLCVSYDRLLEISTDVGTSLCKYFEDIDTVCPPHLKKKVFTSSAVDNINHQPSATTAKSAFNGTGISVFQHINTTNQLDEVESVLSRDSDAERAPVHSKPGGRQRLPKLAVSYTDVPPVPQTKLSCSAPQTDDPMTSYCPLLTTARQLEYRWLQRVCLAVKSGTEVANVTWAAYHANNEDPMRTEVPNSTSYLLPLFQDSAATVSMMRHSFDVIKKVTELANPGQAPVITVDQPLYAIAKKIQWNWPSVYGEDKFVIMFGGLHIELAALKALGDVLDGSGWTTLIVDAEVASTGTADSFLKAAHITRTRHAHQVTACALYQAMEEAHQRAMSVKPDSEAIGLDEWCSQQEKTQPTFKFWFMVLQLQLVVLMFVRSIRNGDFLLYIDSLTKLAHWFFALDHYNYARWIPVHLRDMTTLSTKHPLVHTEFMNGNFTVRKTSHSFSRIAIDQAHEQNNAMVKGDGGAIGLTESQSALERWMVSGPMIASLINDFETVMNGSSSNSDVRHHEQRPGVQKTFLHEVSSLKKMIVEFGNPFMETCGDLVAIHTRDIAEKTIVAKLYALEDLGTLQYTTFVNERLVVNGTKSIDDKIAKNSIRLFKKRGRQTANNQQRVADVKHDRNLFSRLYVACQVRKGNIEQFFSHENQPRPPSLSDGGKLRHGTKSEIVPCLENIVQESDIQSPPDPDVVVLDGPAIVNMLKPRSAKTFQEYSTDVFLPYVKSQLAKAKRVDVVWDDYRKESLKAETREERGMGTRRQVAPNTKIPSNWSEFLRHPENKKELFAFLSTESVKLPSEKQIICTLNETIVSRHPTNTDGLAPCSHEEADSRMMIHVADAAKEHNNIVIRTVDSDVVILAVHVYPLLTNPNCRLRIAFGTGKQFRNIEINEICSVLGPDKCAAIPMFHAFTGCDTVSSFSTKGKKTAWAAWENFPAITEIFTKLMQQPSISDVDDCMDTVERFVVLLYDKASQKDHVNEARLELFAGKGRNVNNIPPTQAALVQHTRRAAYQAGHLWSRALECSYTPPQPEGYGWALSDGIPEITWTLLPEASKVCRELLRCGCTKGCKRTCSCKKAGLVCTALCKCAGSCMLSGPSDRV